MAVIDQKASNAEMDTNSQVAYKKDKVKRERNAVGNRENDGSIALKLPFEHVDAISRNNIGCKAVSS